MVVPLTANVQHPKLFSSYGRRFVVAMQAHFGKTDVSVVLMTATSSGVIDQLFGASVSHRDPKEVILRRGLLASDA